MPRAGNIVIAQGGGPTAVINASLYGIVREATTRPSTGSNMWGARNGITGVLENRWIDLSRVRAPLWEQVANSPGAALGSCRKMLNDEEAVQAVRALEAKDVRYFFYVGGNDSMDTALRMNRAARELRYEMICCGIPKTVDNDLAHTDHCPGFGSAARYMAQSATDLGMDVRSLPTPVSVLEVMGRDAGWLTAATLLARRKPDDAPHLIYVPEVPLTAERFLEDVREVYERLGWVVAAVSEGVRNEKGESWGGRRKEATVDGFGHGLPGDVAATLASLVSSELGLRARSEKPGLLSRASGLMVSSTDRREAEAVGAFGFSWAMKGNSGFMATIERVSSETYGVTYGAVALETVANQARLLPLHYLTQSGSDIKEEYRAYAEPLIGGPLAQYACLDAVPSARANSTVRTSPW